MPSLCLILGCIRKKKKSRFTCETIKCSSSCISWGALIARHDSNGHKTGGTH